MISTTVPPEHKNRKWVRALLLVICGLIAAMWVYAFVFAPKNGVYLVTDKAWRSAADDICTRAAQQRLALADTSDGYIAHPTKDQMLEHADIVDRATDTLDEMVDEIAALPLAKDDDRTRVGVFLKYYRVILDDRREYTARLRAFELEPYLESVVNGGPVTNVVVDFTTGNAIPACMPPGELGGDA
jgi:hypothetical protein